MVILAGRRILRDDPAVVVQDLCQMKPVINQSIVLIRILITLQSRDKFLHYRFLDPFSLQHIEVIPDVGSALLFIEIGNYLYILIPDP